MFNKKRLCALLSVIMLGTSIVPAYATTQDQITNAQAAQDKAESDYNQTQNVIDDLESKKNNLQEYLETLNQQLTILADKLEEIQNQQNEKQADLERIQASLERAKEQEQQQYQEMKSRIQYLYEKSDSSYIEILLSAESFADFLNKADMISQIGEYDRKKLQEYRDTMNIIAQQEAQVESDKQDLEELQSQQEAKQQEIETLVEATDEQIGEYAADINQAENKAASYLEQVNQQKAAIQALYAKQQEEQRLAEAAAQAAAAQEAAAKAAAAQLVAEQAAAQASAQQQAAAQAAAEQAAAEAARQQAAAQQAQQQQQAASGSTSAPAQESSPAVETPSTGDTYLGTFKLTAYCPCAQCCGRANAPTASGVMPSAGRTVAMSGVPFGTKLRINGTVYTVEDRGTAYGHVDIFCSSHSEALNFGLQYADVYQVN